MADGVRHIPAAAGPRAGAGRLGDSTGLTNRWITAPPEGAWDGYVLSEWDLRGAEWSDRHPHDEVNFVVEGELHVECDGTLVVATAGDTVIVPAGLLARYRSPTYARMFAVYGPNPTGTPTTDQRYRELPTPDAG